MVDSQRVRHHGAKPGPGLLAWCGLLAAALLAEAARIWPVPNITGIIAQAAHQDPEHRSRQQPGLLCSLTRPSPEVPLREAQSGCRPDACLRAPQATAGLASSSSGC